MKRRDLLGLALLAPWSVRPAWSRLPVALPDAFALYGALPAGTRPQRLLAAGPPAAVLLYMLAPQAMLGWPARMAPAALEQIAPAWRALPHIGRLAGRGSTMPLERVVALQPDLIVDTGTLNDTYRSTAQRTARQTGVPYLLIDGDILLAPQTLQTLGRLLNVTQRGQQLADCAQSILTEAESLRQYFRTSGTAPSFYVARGPDGLETAPAGSIHAQALELCGLRNVVPAMGSAGLTHVSPEQLLLWDPDYVFTHDPSLHAAAPAILPWSRLRAVREDRFILAPDAPFGWLEAPPGMNRLMGVHWLTRSLAPDASHDATRRALSTLFEVLYHHAPSDSLLDTAARLLT